MPTVWRSGPYRFFFFSNEGSEPPHIHVEAADNHAKFWLDPVHLASSVGFSSAELTRLRRVIAGQEALFLEKWHEYFAGEDDSPRS